jgi:L-histidine N-alpha-methyltransferase
VILESEAAAICDAANRPASLIELGSGSARKTRVLLDAMSCAGCLETYCPVDISEEITRDTADRIAAEYDGINVRGLVCDFEFDLERVPVGGPRVIALLGGTIGNFEPHQRAGFLRRIANLLDPEDRFLLGTDLVKDRDARGRIQRLAGVTAEFNRNVLLVLNRELGADFEVEEFDHVARGTREPLGRHPLRSLANQVGRLWRSTCWSHSRRARRCDRDSTKFAREGLDGIYAEAGRDHRQRTDPTVYTPCRLPVPPDGFATRPRLQAAARHKSPRASPHSARRAASSR